MDTENTSTTHPSITKELLSRALRHAKDDDVSVESFEVQPGSGLGDNFACVVYAVDVTATIHGERKVYNFMIKCLPESDMRKEWIRKLNMFTKETKVYRELIPDMLLFQKKADKETCALSFPKCYYGFADGTSDTLVLENLKCRGYKMADKRQGVDYEHCKLVMTTLANFHATSFAMKQKSTEPLKRKYSFLEDFIFDDSAQEIIAFWCKGYTDLIQLTALNPDYCQYANRMKKYNGTLINNLRELLEPKEPFSVICHGDCWCNNMLFSYEEKEGENVPVSVQLVDLQLTRYALPTTDLAYFLYTSTTPTLRKDHLEDLLKLYHETFLDCMKQLDDDAPMYTFKELKANFYDSLLYGYLSACLILPPILSNPKNLPEIDELTKGSMEEFEEQWRRTMQEEVKTNKPMQERIFGMIAEVAEKGII